jgi:hypothetical protein
MEDTLKVVFHPARNGTGIICRLPSGKVAFPSRLYWNQPPPQPFELWLVRPCGETASVGYVKPIQRLAEAPFQDTRTGRFGNSLLWRLGCFLAALVGLAHRPPGSGLPITEQANGDSQPVSGREWSELKH